MPILGVGASGDKHYNCRVVVLPLFVSLLDPILEVSTIRWVQEDTITRPVLSKLIICFSVVVGDLVVISRCGGI